MRDLNSLSEEVGGVGSRRESCCVSDEEASSKVNEIMGGGDGDLISNHGEA